MLGTGTQADPYIIQTPDDLNNVRNNLSAYYELGNDIDMTGYTNFLTIVNFAGEINGNGYKIINLTIISTRTDDEKYFPALVSNYNSNKPFVIKKLGLENIYYENLNSTSFYRIGGIAGFAKNATIEECFVTGEIQTNAYTGGIAGTTMENSSITNCFTDVKIISSSSRISGISGTAIDDPVIKNCYAVGKMTSTGRVFGIMGSTSTNAMDNYWDIETTGTDVSGNATGLTTEQMKQQSSYTGWDFENVWGIDGGYPYLKIFNKETPPTGNTEELTITSTIKPLFTTVDISKLKNNTLPSHMVKINSGLERTVGVLRGVKSHTLPITLDTSREVISSNVVASKVASHINPITTNLIKITTTDKSLTSWLKPINLNIDTVIPGLIPNIVFADVWHEQNLSNIMTVENKSNIYCIENPSFTEVVE